MTGTRLLLSICAVATFVAAGCDRESGSKVRPSTALDNARVEVLRRVNILVAKKKINSANQIDSIQVSQDLYQIINPRKAELWFLISELAHLNETWILEDVSVMRLSDRKDIFYNRQLGVKKDGAVVAAETGYWAEHFSSTMHVKIIGKSE